MTNVVLDPIAIARLVAAAVESAGGAYFVGGSVASSLQGDPRSTNDIDFVVSMPIGAVDAFIAGLGPDFEMDRDMLRDALRRAATANGFYLPVLTKVDIFGLGIEPFDEIEFSRRRAVVVGRSGETLVVKSPEDSVLRKLLWYRDGGEVSEKQWRDIVSILRVSREDLDRAYVAQWAARLRCTDLLLRAEKDAELA
jgi:hypothetical protein